MAQGTVFNLGCYQRPVMVGMACAQEGLRCPLKEECVELLDRVQQGQAEGENVAKASLRYFTDPFNVLDLSSYIILAVAMYNWYQITNANIYAPVMMVAERAADRIAGQPDLPTERLKRAR